MTLSRGQIDENTANVWKLMEFDLDLTLLFTVTGVYNESDLRLNQSLLYYYSPTIYITIENTVDKYFQVFL